MPVLDDVERAALVAADEELSGLQEALEAAARSNALDKDLVERLRATALEAAGRVNQHLPPQIDADSRDEIRRRLIDLLTMRAGEGRGPLDVADEALVQAEEVRHVMRDLLQEQPPAHLRQAGAVIALLEEWLPALSVQQLANLLGVSPRQVQRRRHDTGPSTPRMQLVARLVAILRHAWTDQGVYGWFYRPRDTFTGRAPIELLDDVGSERLLLLAARSGRVQGGD